jgi:hypothetical protein
MCVGYSASQHSLAQCSEFHTTATIVLIPTHKKPHQSSRYHNFGSRRAFGSHRQLVCSQNNNGIRY